MAVQVKAVMQYYVHYVDYNKRLDEWVTEDRLDTRKIEPPQGSVELTDMEIKSTTILYMKFGKMVKNFF